MTKIIHSLNLFNYWDKFPIVDVCFKSWKKYGGNCEIKVWTESGEEISQIIKNSRYCQLLKEKFGEEDTTNYKPGVSNYLKNVILYRYGGAFLDSDIELLSEFPWQVSFCKNAVDSDISPYVPIYFDAPYSPLLKIIIDKYDTTNDIRCIDADFSHVSCFSKPEERDECNRMLRNGNSNDLKYNHFVKFRETPNGPVLWFFEDVVLYVVTSGRYNKIFKRFENNNFTHLTAFVFDLGDNYEYDYNKWPIGLKYFKTNIDDLRTYLKCYSADIKNYLFLDEGVPSELLI